MFVIPPGSRLTCPQRPDEKWRLFSAELSVDATTTTPIASASATGTVTKRPASDEELMNSRKRGKQPALTTTTTANTPIASMSGTSTATKGPASDKELTNYHVGYPRRTALSAKSRASRGIKIRFIIIIKS